MRQEEIARRITRETGVPTEAVTRSTLGRYAVGHNHVVARDAREALKMAREIARDDAKGGAS